MGVEFFLGVMERFWNYDSGNLYNCVNAIKSSNCTVKRTFFW